MTDEQQRIIDELLFKLRSLLYSRPEKLPATWSALQLKEWIADVAREEFCYREMEKRLFKRKPC